MKKAQEIKRKYLEKCELANRKRVEKYKRKWEKAKYKCEGYTEILHEQSTEEWKNSKVKEDVIKAKAYISILVGCVLLLISFILNIYLSLDTQNTVTKNVFSAFLSVLNIVISMIVGIGVSTIVLDFFSYVQYTRERIKEVIIDKTFIKKLSDDEKRSIIFKAEESLYFKDGKILPNSLYADVKKKITPLLEACYFSDFNVSVSCDVDESVGLIKKEILKTMKIISNEDNAKFQLPFSIYLHKADLGEIKQSYDVTSCFFGSKDITKDFLEKQEKTDEENDNVRFKQNYEFILKKGENIIELRTETTVPISDKIYMHTITLPCMKYMATFTVNTDGYTVDGYGFALEDDLQKHKRNVNYSRIGNSFTIRIDEWALPGEGSIFILNQSKEH